MKNHRILAAVLAAILSSVLPAGAQDASQKAFENAVADKILDAAGTRTWFFGAGSFSSALSARAAERGLAIRVLPAAPTPVGMLPEGAMDAALAMGQDYADAMAFNPAVFARLWMNRDPDAARKAIVLFRAPELWRAENLPCAPAGLVYLSPEKDVDLDAAYEEAVEFWGDLGELILDSEYNRTTADTADVRRWARAQASRLADELGYTLQEAGRTNQAYEAYTRAGRLSSGNVSSLFNRLSLARRGVHPEAMPDLVRRLSDSADSSQEILNTLSLEYGPVACPEDFIEYFPWALSGLPASAPAERLDAVVASASEELRDGLRELYSRRFVSTQRCGSDAAFPLLKKLSDPASRAETCLAVARTLVADESSFGYWYGEAEKAGAPGTELALARCAFLGARQKTPEMLALLRKALESAPESVPLWRNLVSVQSGMKDAAGLRETAAAMESVASMPKQHILYTRAQVRILEDKHEEAHALLKEAAVSDPKDLGILDALLSACAATMPAHNDEIESVSGRIIELLPGHPLANYFLGSLALQKNDLETAERFLGVSIRANPTGVALNDYANVLLLRGKYVESEAFARSAVEAMPGNPAVIDTLAEALLRQEKFDDAVPVIEESIKAFGDMPPLPTVLLHQTLIYEGAGRADDARALLPRLKLCVPDFSPAELEEYTSLRKRLEK